MKTFSRLMCLLLVLLLATCSALADEEVSGGKKIANGDVTLTIYINMRPGAAQAYTTYAEHPVVKKMAEETGLNFEFIHPAGDTETFFNVTVASDEWPDLWCTGNFKSYPGGIEGAMEDGILLNINELVEEYAPDFQKLVNQYGVKNDFLSDTGTLLYLGQTMNCDYVYDKNFMGFIARKDILNELNIKEPVTYADWDMMLSTLQKNGFPTPLAIPFKDSNTLSLYNSLSAGYGVTHSGFFIQDGAVVYSPVQEGYREYLRMLKDWYDKGYFNADSFGYDTNGTKASMQEGKTAICFSHAAHTSTVKAVGSAITPSFDVMGLKVARKNAEDVVRLVHHNKRTSNGDAWFVSAKSPHAKECVQFVNYLYQKETQLLTAWGVGTEEYPTFKINENGTREFTEWMKNNPDGLDFQIMKDRFILGPFQTIYDEDTEVAQYNYPEKLQALEAFNWQNNGDGEYPDKATLTIDESSELTQIVNQATTYSDEMMQKFITGLASLDDDWDTYVKQLEAMNISRACQIKQAALERYLNR